MLDAVLRGLIKTHAQAEDVHVPQEMTNKMFMDGKVKSVENIIVTCKNLDKKKRNFDKIPPFSSQNVTIFRQ